MLPEGIIIVLGFLLLFVKMATTAAKTRRVYLVDFACYKPPESQSCTWAFVAQQFCSMGKLSERNLDFMQKTMERSGMGDSSYLSEGLIKKPVQISLEDALSETRAAMFGAVRDLLEKTGLSGSDIGILVVNSTVFCVNPSLSAMIVHEFKLRDNVNCYSLQGMGCSAGGQSKM